MMIGIGTPRSHSKIPRPMIDSFQRSDELNQQLAQSFRATCSMSGLIRRLSSSARPSSWRSESAGRRGEGDFCDRGKIVGTIGALVVLGGLVTRFPCPPAPSASFCPVRVVLGRGLFSAKAGVNGIRGVATSGGVLPFGLRRREGSAE